MILETSFKNVFVYQIEAPSLCQDVCHSFTHCEYFTFFQGSCKLYSSGQARSSCGTIAGSPAQSVEECILGEVTDGGCDAFIEEECDYHGGDTGFSAPEGEITNPRECEEYCLLFQVRSEPFQTNITTIRIFRLLGAASTGCSTRPA